MTGIHWGISEKRAEDGLSFSCQGQDMLRKFDAFLLPGHQRIEADSVFYLDRITDIMDKQIDESL